MDFLWASWKSLIGAWLVLCCAAIGLWSGLSVVEQRITNAQTKYEELQKELSAFKTQTLALSKQRQTNPKFELSKDFTQAAPVSVSTNKLLNQMTELAAKGAVSITEFQVQEHTETATELPRTEVVVRARGSYPMTKAWIAQMQQRYPWLTVQRWSMQKANTPNIDSVLVLNLWKRPLLPSGRPLEEIKEQKGSSLAL